MKTALLLFVLCCGVAAAAKQPTFLARHDYPVNGDVAVTDVNGDGIPDVISWFGSTVFTLLGNGDGTFRVGPSSQIGFEYIGGLVPIDLNGDGKVDLVVTGGPDGIAIPSGLGVSFGNGDGTFGPATLYQAGTEKFIGRVVVADFNGDGIPDAVVPGGNGIWMFTGKGGGIFNPGVLTPVAGLQSAEIVSADFNGDGHRDVAVACTVIGSNPISGFIVAFGNGDGTFQLPVAYNTGRPYDVGQEIATGDLNGDGRPDIAVTSNVAGTTDVYIYLNDGRGGFFKPGQATLYGGIPFAIGDVNGDGIPDLINAQGYIAYGEGKGKFAAPVYYPMASVEGPETVVLADLTNNGRLDIVAGEVSATSVLLNAGKGKLEDGVWTSVPGSGNCGAAADFDSDGKPDLAVPTSEGITVLLGTGKASSPYTTGASITLSGAGCPITGDLNGDGIPDLLVGANSAGGVVAYLGNGDGTFTLKSTTAVSSGVLALGDFNHDGKLDFAVSSNQLALGNGDGTFQVPASIVSDPPSGGYSWIAAGDINNDGWTDLVLTNWNITRSLYVLLNNQNGGFTQSAIANHDGPLAIVLADLNGDGNLDAVLMMEYLQNAVIYLGNGKGGFTLQEATLPYPGSYYSPPTVGDVNGDGIPDILLPASGSVGMWLGRGDGTFPTSVSYGTGLGASEILLENLHGQPPKADLPDIVAPDSTGGVTVLLNTTK
jgi:hypothetical protein